jgi:hypothetical protein
VSVIKAAAIKSSSRATENTVFVALVLFMFAIIRLGISVSPKFSRPRSLLQKRFKLKRM